jgi:co-chaperonin GroES (HSP10)
MIVWAEGKYVVIQPIEKRETTEGGVYIPSTRLGTYAAVLGEVMDISEELVTVATEVGSVVYYLERDAHKLENTKLVVVHVDDILAVVEEGNE